jgi:DNA polymerase-1
MQLELGLQMKLVDEQEKATERVKKAKEKKAKAVYLPTWDEVWYSGYANKKGIFQTKLSPLDRERLQAVKEAIDSGELGMMCENTKKFTKTHALGLYKVLMEQRKEGIIADMIKHKPVNYYLVRTGEMLKETAELLDRENEIAIDTETNGLDPNIHHIVGISLTLPKADKHYYIPIRHEIPEVMLDAKLVFNTLRGFLENELLGKYLANFKFDAHMFYKEGIYLKGLKMDVIIAMQILNENEMSYALKNISTKYGRHFGFEDKSMTYEELFGKGGFEKTPFDIGTVYACKDTHLTYKLGKWIETQFERLPELGHIYNSLEVGNTVASFDMEKNGLPIDLEFASKYTEILRAEVKELEKKVYDLFGDINFNSGQQVAKVLYDDWGLEDISGKRSVDADTIKALSHGNENLKLLLEYRGKNKLLNTYFEALPTKVWSVDNRLHGRFNQTGTKTGRYSSNDPNLQNIPPEARPMIVAPKGKVIIGKDLSQIEPRCLAYMSNDSEFQKPYLTGGDLYTSLAERVFKLDHEYCVDGAYDPTHTFKPRKRMKTGLLAVMYGTSMFTLSQQLEITVEEAEQFIEDFFATYPECATYIQGIKDFVDKNGYVTTNQGRKRRFPEHKDVARRYKAVAPKIAQLCGGKIPSNIWSDEYKTVIPYKLKKEYWAVAKTYQRVHRQAVNAVIQGSSADYIKLVMLRVNEYLKTLGPEYKLIATIHDEILMEVPTDITADIIAELDRIMTNIEWFHFPVKTDTVVFKTWGGEEVPAKDFLAEREKYLAEWEK